MLSTKSSYAQVEVHCEERFSFSLLKLKLLTDYISSHSGSRKTIMLKLIQQKKKHFELLDEVQNTN